MKPIFRAFAFVFAPIFAFSLYLLACTASIGPSYQPDIARISWFHPGLVLIVSFIIASLLAQHRREVVRFLQLALVLCAVAFVIVVGGDSSGSVSTPPSPAGRTLHSTISIALAHPQFSNRSYSAPFYSAVLVAILWLVHHKRNYPNDRNA